MISSIFVRLYALRRLRWIVAKMVRRLEGGEFRSTTLRRIFSKYWEVDIGLYSHGACFVPWAADRHTKIGRYCSIAEGVRIVNHNHPLNFKGTSGLFFNPALGYCDDWLVEFNPIDIGNDVWIGAHAIILPEVNRIGNGAVIGAGAVVYKDVPDYAVVIGNPGRVVKYRFTQEVIERLLAEAWWEKDMDEIAEEIELYQAPLG